MRNDLSYGELVETEASLDDQSEQATIEQLLRESCTCQLGPHGVACSSAVSKEAIVLTRNNCLQMARKELDLVVMAQINTLRTPAATEHPPLMARRTSDHVFKWSSSSKAYKCAK